MGRKFSDQELNVLDTCLKHAGVPEVQRKAENPFLKTGPLAEKTQAWAIELAPAIAKEWQAEAQLPQGLMAERIKRGLRENDQASHQHLLQTDGGYREAVQQRAEQEFQDGLKFLEREAEEIGKRRLGERRYAAEQAQQQLVEQQRQQRQQEGVETERRIAQSVQRNRSPWQ